MYLLVYMHNRMARTSVYVVSYDQNFCNCTFINSAQLNPCSNTTLFSTCWVDVPCNCKHGFRGVSFFFVWSWLCFVTNSFLLMKLFVMDDLERNRSGVMLKMSCICSSDSISAIVLKLDFCRRFQWGKICKPLSVADECSIHFHIRRILGKFCGISCVFYAVLGSAKQFSFCSSSGWMTLFFISLLTE